jgi:flagellar biogenesis protein FliO
MSTTVLLLRFVVATVVVTAMLGVLAKWMRRGRAAGPRSELEVVARRPLGRSSSVAIVRAGSSTVLVGVTDGQVSMLLDHVEIDEGGPARAAGMPRPHGTRSPAADRAGSSVRALTAPRTAPPTGSNPDSSWTAALHGLRERTVRRG